MAEFSQKLKVRLKNGTVQTIKIYSTAADIPTWQKPMKVRLAGNVIGWVPTSPLGSPDASSLRVRHPGSSAIYVVNTIGRATYGSQIFYNPGYFNFTVPSGARKLRITLVGGGSTGYYRYQIGTARAGSNVGEGSSFAGYYAAPAGAAPAQSTQYAGQKIPPENGYLTQYGINAGTTHSFFRIRYDDDGYTGYWNGNDYMAGGIGFGAGSAGFKTGERTHWRGGLRGGIIQNVIVNSVPETVMSGYVGRGGAGFVWNDMSGESWDRSTLGAASQGCVLIEWGGSIE